MLISGTLKDWSIGYTGSPIQSTLWLGATSLQDLNKATHKATAYTASGEDSIFSIGFDEIELLPTMPYSVTIVSQTLSNGQYYDQDLLPILCTGSILGSNSSSFPAILVLDLDYASPVTIKGVLPNCVVGCSYMYSQGVKIQCMNRGSDTVLAETSITKLYSNSPTVSWSSGWSSTISQLCNRVRLTITATHNVSYSNTKTTIANCLPYTDLVNPTTKPLATQLPIPTYGLILDPITGTTMYVSDLDIDLTAIRTINIG